MIGGDDCGAISGAKEWQGKPLYQEKTCPSTAVSTTDPIRLDMGSNSGRHGGKPTIKRLGYGTAMFSLSTVFSK
jgi:hypothetical protein